MYRWFGNLRCVRDEGSYLRRIQASSPLDRLQNKKLSMWFNTEDAANLIVRPRRSTSNAHEMARVSRGGPRVCRRFVSGASPDEYSDIVTELSSAKVLTLLCSRPCRRIPLHAVSVAGSDRHPSWGVGAVAVFRRDRWLLRHLRVLALSGGVLSCR